MNDFRLPIQLSEVTDDRGNTYTDLILNGQHFSVQGWELKREEPWFVYSKYERPSTCWKVWLDLREVPRPPAPKKNKRRMSDLGLRRPK